MNPQERIQRLREAPLIAIQDVLSRNDPAAKEVLYLLNSLLVAHSGESSCDRCRAAAFLVLDALDGGGTD